MSRARVVEVTLTIKGQTIRFLANPKELLTLVAKRLDCLEEEVVFKVSDGGNKAVETVIADQAWSTLGKKPHVQIHAERKKKKAHHKRKSTHASNDGNNSSAAETDSGQSSSSSTSLRRSPPRSMAVGGVASSSNSSSSQKRIKSSVEVVAKDADQTNHRSTISRRRWGPKDDRTLWKEFEVAAKALASKSDITPEQKEKFFYDLTLRPGLTYRSMECLRSKLRIRLTNAVERKENVPELYLKLFPRLYNRQQGALARQKGAYMAELEADSEESSSESASGDDFRPPRTSNTSLKPTMRTSPRINEHNPFASIAAVPPREFSRRGRPSWSRSARADAAKAASTSTAESSASARPRKDLDTPTEQLNHPKALSRTEGGTSVSLFGDSSLSSHNLHDGAVNMAEEGSTAIRMDPVAVASSSSSAPPLRRQVKSVAAAATVPAPLPAQRQASASASRQASAPTATPREASEQVLAPAPDPASAAAPRPSNVAPRSTSTLPLRVAHIDAIEIKSESDDDGPNRPSHPHAKQATPSVVPVRTLARVKEEALEIREVVRQHIRPILPLRGLCVLPSPAWASRLAYWLKRNVLKRAIDEKSRTDHMAIVFEEFFYASYSLCNTDWSIRLSSFVIALLLLDLFDALGDDDSAEARKGLVEILYLRLFDLTAPPLSTPVEWPPFDLCIAATLILPVRPAWLLSQVFERSNHFAIQEVPPRNELVEHHFTRLHLLLKKMQVLQEYAKNIQKVKVVITLSQLAYNPGIDVKMLSNLEALHRQSKARVGAETNAKAEETIKLVHQVNEVSREQMAMRRVSEESFFREFLLLLSSTREIDPQSVQAALMREDSESSSSSTATTTMAKTRITTWKKRFESSIQTWHLCVLQFDSVKTRESTRKSMHNLLTSQPMQMLPDWKIHHSRCQTLEAKTEQETWHRTCCSLHFHRHCHRRDAVREEEQEQQPKVKEE